MKTVDTCKTGLIQLNWSPDGQLFTYVRNENEICKGSVSNPESVTQVAKGMYPNFNADNEIVFERDDEIFAAGSGGERCIVSKKDLLKDAPKRRPSVSPDGKDLVFVIENVFHKESHANNAYAYRSFIGKGAATGKSAMRMLDQQWYGGRFAWMPEGGGFCHFEYDSTGGARIHVCDKDGKAEGTMFGLYPAVSPDGRRIACKPKTGQNVVVYSLKKGADIWEQDNIETTVCKLPEGGRISGTSPIWLDNRHVLIDEGGLLFRVDINKGDAAEYKHVPLPVFRSTNCAVMAPGRHMLMVEVEQEDGFALKLVEKL